MLSCRLRHSVFALLLCVTFVPCQSQVTRTTLFGIGRERLLDTYLSPWQYDGTSFSVTHLTERMAHWGDSAVVVASRYDAVGGATQAQYGGSRMLDGQLTLSSGLLYRLKCEKLRFHRITLAFGGVVEGTLGGTYHTSNENNPVQVRIQGDVAFQGVMQYAFSPYRKSVRDTKAPWLVHGELTMPLVGMAFAQQYGESYFELVSLRHYDHNVRAIWPGNAPTFRILGTLQIPVRKSYLTLGYNADVRQSRLNALKRHAWHQQFLVGFTRRLCLVR